MEEKIKNCVYCNKEFVYKNIKNIYCSDNCKAKHSRENKGILISKKCKNCEKIFESIGESKIYCSDDCKKEYYIKNPIKHKYTLVCNNCGKIFEKISANKPKENKNYYCSRECIGINKNKIGIESSINCKHCGVIFKQIHKRHFFCSENCKIEYNIIHAPTKIVNCSTCGKEIERVRCLKQNNYFCSKECESRFRENEANDIRKCKYCKKEFECKKHDKLIFCSRACQICGMNKSPTKPHRDILQFIEELGFSFEIEKPIKRYSIDIYLLDYKIGIEIMGSYWHCDSRIYDFPKYKAQDDGIKKDKKKNEYLKNNNIPTLYLWELDINKNFDICKKLIIKFIENCGILNNYHSMNYIIDNNILVTNSRLLIPYFEK
jgi:G:T-mismatch repair DNA endonuclease (very short patch repair protein)/YHS domain-containing protein